MGQNSVATSSPFHPVRPFSSFALISATIISRPKIQSPAYRSVTSGTALRKPAVSHFVPPTAKNGRPILFRRLPKMGDPFCSAGCHSHQLRRSPFASDPSAPPAAVRISSAVISIRDRPCSAPPAHFRISSAVISIRDRPISSAVISIRISSAVISATHFVPVRRPILLRELTLKLPRPILFLSAGPFCSAGPLCSATHFGQPAEPLTLFLSPSHSAPFFSAVLRRVVWFNSKSRVLDRRLMRFVHGIGGDISGRLGRRAAAARNIFSGERKRGRVRRRRKNGLSATETETGASGSAAGEEL
ncbi:Uncharacterized protein Fot_22545 [Forsythia ovata]|uniref:Uncharacterized protein n=1 Tax=Forsythia ovata TaxID=205694 RepID=A0ABD1UY15_9LAMI